LTGILLGISAGLFLSFYKKSLRYSQKERRLTAGIYVLSTSFLAAAVSFILFGNGASLYDRGIIIAASCFIIIGTLAVLFPKIFLFPLIIPAGLCIVLTAYLFLRYPLTGSGVIVTRIMLPVRDTIVIKPEYPKLASINYNKIINSVDAPHKYKNYYNIDHPFTLEYTALVITANYLIPFIGGERRSVLLGLNLVDDNNLRLKLYTPSFLDDTFAAYLPAYNFLLMNAQRFFGQMKLNDLELYRNYTIYFDYTRGPGGAAFYKVPLSPIAYTAQRAPRVEPAKVSFF
jgi:hypothetical protein